MPKIYKRDSAIYQIEIAKLATAQVQLETEKERRERLNQELQSELRKQNISLNLVNVALILAAIGVVATIWAGFKG